MEAKELEVLREIIISCENHLRGISTENVTECRRFSKRITAIQFAIKAVEENEEYRMKIRDAFNYQAELEATIAELRKEKAVKGLIDWLNLPKMSEEKQREAEEAKRIIKKRIRKIAQKAWNEFLLE